VLAPALLWLTLGEPVADEAAQQRLDGNGRVEVLPNLPPLLAPIERARNRAMSNVTVEAWLSLAVVAVFAVALTAISIRVFSRSAVS
jgi:hypothetical protein